ncbi:hypothetical protein Ancab_040486 [Ancistrocladus abbreviatus]
MEAYDGMRHSATVIYDRMKVVNYKRKEPPAHYSLEIQSYRSFLSSFPFCPQNIESTEFLIEGYKWTLLIYPNDDHDDLCLVLRLNEPRDRFPVKAMCKFFLYDFERGMYLVVHGPEALRFEYEFPQHGVPMLPASDFTDANNGYLSHDRCMFGVEVTILRTTAKKAVLTALNIGRDNLKETWGIQNFRELSSESDVVHSHQFNMGGRLWKLVMYPKGYGENQGKSLALFLVLLDCSNLTGGRKLYVYLEFCVKNMRNEPDITKTVVTCYGVSSAVWGSDLILLSDLHNLDKGFKVDDKLFVEVEVKHMYLMNEC